MEITELINPENIKLDLLSSAKEEAIGELAQLLFNSGFINDKEEVVKAALIREKEFTTGVGLEVAIPHAKSSFVIKPGVAFGRSRKGLEWDTVDGLPPKLIFLIVVPTDAHDQHLQVLAQISRKIIHDDVREKLLQALEAESILETLK